jgi:hypothetical protein
MVSSYEKGRQFPSMGSLNKILEVLNADLVDLQAAMGALGGELSAIQPASTPPPVAIAPGPPPGSDEELARAILVLLRYLWRPASADESRLESRTLPVIGLIGRLAG